MLRMNRYGNFQSSIIRFATKCNFSAIIHGADEAWKLPKKVLGQRALIIIGENGVEDKANKEYLRRMLFEFQIIGKQAVNYTVNTAYPTFKNVEECVDIARRVGVNCIITIGSGSISDVGKGARSLLESGIKKFNELDNIVAKESKKPLETIIPLFCVSTTISPVPLSPSWAYLHHEDDLLIKRSCKEPDGVVFDYNIISKSSSFSDLASGGYFWSHLFDSIFSYSLYYLNKGLDPSIIEINYKDLLKLDKYSLLITNVSNLLERKDFDLNNTTCDITKPDNDLLSKLCEIISQLNELRSHIHSIDDSLSTRNWPGLIESSCMLSMTNPNRNFFPPHSWLVSSSLRLNCMRVLMKTTKSVNKKKSDENMIKTATSIALKISTVFHNDSVNNIIDENNNIINNLNNNSILMKKALHKLKLKWKNKDGSSNEESMSAAGLIEGMITVEELELENRQKIINNKNINYKSSIIDKDVYNDSLRLKLFKSDLMLDFTEEILLEI